jgi:hypothetical protein
MASTQIGNLKGSFDDIHLATMVESDTFSLSWIDYTGWAATSVSSVSVRLSIFGLASHFRLATRQQKLSDRRRV